MKRLSAVVALSLACTAALAFRTADTPRARVSTIASFPGIEVSQVAVGGRGRFIYLATNKGLILYDRIRKQSRTITKENFNTLVGSPSGDRLGMLRNAESGTPGNGSSLAWTLAIDPSTGDAIGVPRRVSMTAADALRISPDGQHIAFIATEGKRRIVVVPINGGVERTIAEGNFWAPIRWSPDGSAIYVARFSQAGRYVARISLATGATADATPAVALPGPGVTPDGKYVIAQTGGKALAPTYAIFDHAKKRLSSVDVRIPLQSDRVAGAWRIDDAWLNDGYHWVWAMWTAPTFVKVADYRRGVSRVIPRLESENVVFSPNGSMVYAEEPDGMGGIRMVVRNADGSNPKQLAAHDGEFSSLLSTPWSPDSRYLLFRADTARSLMVYDAHTGKRARIARSDEFIGEPHWRGDGKAALFLSWDGPADRTVFSAREATLEGRTRTLRDLTSHPDPSGSIAFIGDSIIYGRRSGTVTSFAGETRKLVDVAPLANPPVVGSPFLPSLSPDGRWFARTATNRKGIDIVALDGSARRTIPVSLDFSRGLPVKFHPGGRDVIVPLRRSDEQPGGFAAVPLDGGPARRILSLGKNERLASYSISTDGNMILYTTVGETSIVLLDIDLSPGIPARD